MKNLLILVISVSVFFSLHENIYSQNIYELRKFTEDDWLAMTTPACCGAASKYGARTCEGLVHYGLVHFVIDRGKLKDWNAEVVNIRTTRPAIVGRG